jgi:hypothetical protein
MMLNEEISELQRQCSGIQQRLSDMQKRLEKAKKAWPDFQVRVGAEWYDRSKVPPDGHIWASDGIGVWLIHGRGEPIGEYATAVKFWTEAYIPAPPEFIKSS